MPLRWKKRSMSQNSNRKPKKYQVWHIFSPLLPFLVELSDFVFRVTDQKFSFICMASLFHSVPVKSICLLSFFSSSQSQFLMLDFFEIISTNFIVDVSNELVRESSILEYNFSCYTQLVDLPHRLNTQLVVIISLRRLFLSSFHSFSLFHFLHFLCRCCFFFLSSFSTALEFGWWFSIVFQWIKATRASATLAFSETLWIF